MSLKRDPRGGGQVGMLVDPGVPVGPAADAGVSPCGGGGGVAAGCAVGDCTASGGGGRSRHLPPENFAP